MAAEHSLRWRPVGSGGRGGRRARPDRERERGRGQGQGEGCRGAWTVVLVMVAAMTTVMVVVMVMAMMGRQQLLVTMNYSPSILLLSIVCAGGIFTTDATIG